MARYVASLRRSALASAASPELGRVVEPDADNRGFLGFRHAAASRGCRRLPGWQPPLQLRVRGHRDPMACAGFGRAEFRSRPVEGAAAAPRWQTPARNGKSEHAMPTWQGCRVLQTGEVLVLANHPASFDSRYFGPLHTASIMGRAVLLWSHRPAD